MKTAKLTERQEAMLDANAGCLVAFVGLLSFPFVAGCVFFIAMGVMQGRVQSRLNTTAVEMSATIVSSEVTTSTTSTGPGTSSTSRTSYYAMVEYDYEVAGTAYRGDSVWPVPESFGDRSKAEAVVRRFPVGTEVTGYIDPSDPATSFLETRWSVMPYVAALAGSSMLCLLAAGGVFVLGWRWIGTFFWIAAASSMVGIGIVGWIGRLWLVHVPPDARPGWMTVAVGAAGFAALLPMLLLFRARAGARLYRQAARSRAESAAAQQQGVSA